MSCADRPPPGFGAAAAGGRPLRGESGGTKSATRTNTRVIIKTETVDGNLEILQQSQMQNENKNVPPSKDPYQKFRVDATKAASLGVNASNTGQHLRSCKKSKGLGKHDKVEDNEGAIGLSRPPTPINLFEDECVFCHSFRTHEELHGKMVQYRERRIVPYDKGNTTNGIYVHEKCMVWAPRVERNGDIYDNMEKEISRASRLKCSLCRLPGAALGCYHHPCPRTYHVTCALLIRECRWDDENRHVWCPKHASDPLPCDEMSSPMESDITHPIFHNQCTAKDDISVHCHREDERINPLVTSNSFFPEQLHGQYLDKQGMSAIRRREDQQVDQPNNLSSSFGQGQCSDKDGISADYGREEKQINHSSTPAFVKQDSLKEFASLTSSTLAEEWGKSVTHVIMGTYNKNVPLMKDPYQKFRVDATKTASPVVNASNTGQHLRSCKKSKSLGKHDKIEDNEGAIGLRRPPTPINLFEDECVFCHSFRTHEELHGKMVQYRERRIVPYNKGNTTNGIYVHEKCMVWAPRVERNGDIYDNVEKEISRASRLKCSMCRLPGAALGCYHHPCPRTYHVTCALLIPECRWDYENRHVWCPKHAADPLPCDEMRSPMESDITHPIFHNHCSQCTAKEDISVDCHLEDGRINPLVTSNSFFPEQLPSQYLDKQGICRWEDHEGDQLNNSSSSFGQGQCSDRDGISADYGREEKQIDHSSAPVDQWVLLGSDLSASEKDSLTEFASLTSSTLAEEWGKNVTHVIVGRNAADPSYEVMMAILSGKWVVRTGWIEDYLAKLIPGPKTCLPEPITVPEISYEVEFCDASHTSLDGPKKGRARAAQVAPKLFSGLYFCLSTYLKPEDTRSIKSLIAAAEGQVLEGISPRSLQEKLDKNPAKAYFIYASSYCLDLGKEMKEASEYRASGAQVVSQFNLHDAIAAYDVRIMDRIST